MNKLMTSLFLNASLLSHSSFSFASTDITPYKNAESKSLFGRLIQNNKPAFRFLSLNENHQFKARLEGTTKGNGTILIHNLLIRIFDQHDDGIIYKNGTLSLTTKDVTGNNIKEIILNGIVVYTGEKEADPVEYEALTYIYSLNCKTGVFETIYHYGNYSPVLSDKAAPPLICRK